jgi:hypothetical protein
LKPILGKLARKICFNKWTAQLVYVRLRSNLEVRCKLNFKEPDSELLCNA